MTPSLFDQEARTIKALSLWQPWPTLMALGIKLHETRGRDTRHRGPLALHATKELPSRGLDRDLAEELCGRFGLGPLESLPRGAVLAVGRLESTHRTVDVAHRVTLDDRRCGNYAAGRFAWRVPCEALPQPIPAKGGQWLWDWTPPTGVLSAEGAVLG